MKKISVVFVVLAVIVAFTCLFVACDSSVSGGG